MTLISSEGMKELKAHAVRRERIKELLALYPEQWEIEKEPHNYKDGTTHFTHVMFKRKSGGDEIQVMIADTVTPPLAELLILLREHALATC